MSQVAFLAGCLYTAVGILKLGWLTNFLSHSVISGFMSGASVIIALSQVQPCLADQPYVSTQCSMQVLDLVRHPPESLVQFLANFISRCQIVKLHESESRCACVVHVLVRKFVPAVAYFIAASLQM